MQTFADELSGAFRADAVGSAEDDSIAEIEERDFGPFFAAECRNEGEFRLSCHDGGGASLPDQVDISIGFGDKALGFILPADEEVVVCELTLPGRSGIEPAKRVSIEEKFQNCGYVTAFGLKFLGQGQADNRAVIQGREVECISFCAEYFDNVRVGEVVEIIVDR